MKALLNALYVWPCLPESLAAVPRNAAEPTVSARGAGERPDGITIGVRSGICAVFCDCSVEGCEDR